MGMVAESDNWISGNMNCITIRHPGIFGHFCWRVEVRKTTYLVQTISSLLGELSCNSSSQIWSVNIVNHVKPIGLMRSRVIKEMYTFIYWSDITIVIWSKFAYSWLSLIIPIPYCLLLVLLWCNLWRRINLTWYLSEY